MEVNGVSLHVADEGTGPPVVLLHGWPDTSTLWSEAARTLTAAGYRAVAPDLRGFGRSEKPTEVAAYEAPLVIGDVVGVLDALDLERAHVVGHGWGAWLAWMLGIEAPHRVDRLVVLGVPHPGVPGVEGIEHMEKTWYRWLYQFEGVAEEWLQHDDWLLFREFLAIDQYLTTDDIDAYVHQMSEPGALRGSLNWFRANMPPAPPAAPPAFRPIQAPVLAIWATGDHGRGLLEERMLASRQLVAGEWRYERFDDTGHWVPLERAERFGALLVSWFGGDVAPLTAA